MNRITFPMLMLGLSLAPVLCGAAEPLFPPPVPPPGITPQPGSPVAAADLLPKSRDNDAALLKAAQDERIKVLTELVEMMAEQQKSGTVDVVDQLFSTESELCNALLDSTNEPEKRIALLTKQLDKANDFVKILQAKKEAGTVSPQDVLRAKSQYLGFKIKLLRERSWERPLMPTTQTADNVTAKPKLGPAEKPTKLAEATEPLSMSQVTDYVAAVGHNTTIKNKQIAKRLIGRVYKGIVEVFDVDGDDNYLTITSRWPTEENMRGNWARFEITRPEVIKKAAELPRGAKIAITAKLSSVGTDRSAQSSQASFNETQIVDMVPADKTPPKN